MNRPHYILQPVNPYFIGFSLIVAFLLNLTPLGHLPGIPDFVALVLLFWSIHHPRKIGMGIAFIFGILMDVHEASLFGEHALAYTLLAFGGISLHRRVQWMPVGAQVVYVAPLLMLAQFVPFLIRFVMGTTFPGWTYLIDGIVEAALWPLVSHLLLIPQRRPVDPDDTRPI